MGQPTDAWERLRQLMEQQELDEVDDLYAEDALYLEPYNPPHRGNLLIAAYMKDFFAGKDEVDVEVVMSVEDEEKGLLAVEWAISYTAAGRRWNKLPRGSFLRFDDDGLIAHHRDYS